MTDPVSDPVSDSMSLPIPGYFTRLRELQLRTELNGGTVSEGYTPVARPFRKSKNYEFYIALICLCEMPTPTWVNYNKFEAVASEDLNGFHCSKCGLLDPVSFKLCLSCRSAFYDLFRHPQQGNKQHRCWHCCEKEEAKGLPPNDFFTRRGYTKLAPPAYLLAPAVR